MEVTAGLRWGILIDLIQPFEFIDGFISLGRLNDIERATNAKSQVEQKQRDEAKLRKENSDEWETKVAEWIFHWNFFLNLLIDFNSSPVF